MGERPSLSTVMPAFLTYLPLWAVFLPSAAVYATHFLLEIGFLIEVVLF